MKFSSQHNHLQFENIENFDRECSFEICFAAQISNGKSANLQIQENVTTNSEWRMIWSVSYQQ